MRHQVRRILARLFVVGVAMAGLAGQTGCIPFNGVQFREAALSDIQSGVTSIVNGLIDGVFAAIAVESQTSN
jgi:hypothetical protein